jgi:hypothetical protein
MAFGLPGRAGLMPVPFKGTPAGYGAVARAATRFTLDSTVSILVTSIISEPRPLAGLAQSRNAELRRVVALEQSTG